jgi:hypothetical protein
MKPLPAPHVPGKTEADRFDNAVAFQGVLNSRTWRSRCGLR